MVLNKLPKGEYTYYFVDRGNEDHIELQILAFDKANSVKYSFVPANLIDTCFDSFVWYPVEGFYYALEKYKKITQEEALSIIGSVKMLMELRK
jgi:hypothetical protein